MTKIQFTYLLFVMGMVVTGLSCDKKAEIKAKPQVVSPVPMMKADQVVQDANERTSQADAAYQQFLDNQ